MRIIKSEEILVKSYIVRPLRSRFDFSEAAADSTTLERLHVKDP